MVFRIGKIIFRLYDGQIVRHAAKAMKANASGHRAICKDLVIRGKLRYQKFNCQ